MIIRLMAVALAVFLFSQPSWARHYNSIRLSCRIHGYELSLTPAEKTGPRIRKDIYPEQIEYALDQIVYISDRAVMSESPISYKVAVQGLPLTEESDELLSALESPAWISILRATAQTMVSLELSRENILDLLEFLGSPTAHAFRETLSDFQLAPSRYYPNNTPFRIDAIPKPTLTNFVFTGTFGQRDLETCHQFDPVGLELPNDPYFNGIAYHICGVCNVDLLESSSAAFAPKAHLESKK